MGEEPTLSASLEDYLEAIFHIEIDKRAARPKDISERLGVNSSSVTGALHALAEKDLVNYVPYDVVTLTAAGREVAGGVVRRHSVLHDFFVQVLSVDEADAADAACKMEHAVPQNILERFVQFLQHVQTCPSDGAEWLRHFAEGYRQTDECTQVVSTDSEATRP